MAKKPAGEPAHEPDPPPAVFVTPPEITHQEAPQAVPVGAQPRTTNGNVPPPNIGPFDATADANAVAIIAQYLNLIASQNVGASYLTGELPTSTTQPPVGSDLQSITDALAGASRALGAYINQLNTLQILWPPA